MMLVLKGRTARSTILALFCGLVALWTLFHIPGPLSHTRLNITFRTPPENPSRVGQWGPLIPVPLVPAAAALLPLSGRILLWSADGSSVFTSELASTMTAMLDIETLSVTSHNLSHTNHNMFCPGLSMGSDGHVLVSGGSTSEKFSIYDENLGDWLSGPEMQRGRGYHAQTTLADGRVFTVGGSWSGGVGGKDGELYDPIAERWEALPGCSSLPMLTNDDRGSWFSDNHAWLVTWTNNSVFQAGPSSAMNWYGLEGPGTTVPAGFRGDAEDAMNGNAVMYDALRGKILTVGGARNYSPGPASRAAHIITLGEPFARPIVERMENMHSSRTYANSVVLPTGDVFINGGASWALQWTDVNASMVPEMWSPRTHRFAEMARMPVPRTYHSFAILLPDATVLAGGGGLCWRGCPDDAVNHRDVQVFRPPYLFNEAGVPIQRRPSIVGLSKMVVSPGEELIISADVEYVDLVLIRYASVTHSINTDQRRVKLHHEPLSPVEGVDVSDLGVWNRTTVLPSDPGILVPGYWMVFAVDSHGTPSVAATILISKI